MITRLVCLPAMVIQFLCAQLVLCAQLTVVLVARKIHDGQNNILSICGFYPLRYLIDCPEHRPVEGVKDQAHQPILRA